MHTLFKMLNKKFIFWLSITAHEHFPCMKNTGRSVTWTKSQTKIGVIMKDIVLQYLDLCTN